MKRNAHVKRAYLATLGRLIIDNASGIIFTTEAERDHAGLRHAPADCYVVPVGLSWREYATPPPRGEFRKLHPQLTGSRIILFLGRISRQKGLDLLVQAMKHVVERHPDAHLVIVGPDAEGYRARVEQWIAEAGLQTRVTFTGRLEGRAKLSAYVDCELFVLSSYGENFGATITEALACGRPVVISDRVDIAEEIARAEAGIVVRCTPDSVAAGIDHLLDEPTLAAEMGKRGRTLVQERFTWEAAVPHLINIYESVVSRGR
jgi:glycosyltransferase involved in cell wall biosynthesis